MISLEQILREHTLVIHLKCNPVTIDYTNWRGERSARRIVPYQMSFGSTEFHKDQWLIDAKDLDKDGQTRTFALANIHSWEPAL